MTDQQRLREVLGRSVPAPSRTPGRAAGIRARVQARRRRRATVVGGAVVLAVVAAVGVPYAIGGGTADGPAASGGVVPGEFNCPEPLDQRDPAGQDAPGGSNTLGDDVVAVRLCPSERDYNGRTQQAPADALTAGASALAEHLDALEVGQAEREREDRLEQTGGLFTGMECMAGTSGWTLRFQHSDGSVQDVVSPASGCNGTRVGAVERGTAEDARQLVDLFDDRLATQRARTPRPVGPSAVLPCESEGDTFVDKSSFAMVSAQLPLLPDTVSLCWQSPSTPWRSVPTTDDQLELVLADLDTATFTDDEPSRSICSTRLKWRLTGYNAWGDAVEIESYCGYFFLSSGIAQEPRVWTPAPATRELIDDLVERAHLTP